MSISTELTRMAGNVGALAADTNAIFEALRAKGVDVPPGAQLSDVADMIGEIVPPEPTEVEIGGRTYPIVKIGDQWWLAENLDWKFSGCRFLASSATGYSNACAYYGNASDQPYQHYGLSYDYYACQALYEANILPDGWRVPVRNDYETLITYIGNDASKVKSKTNWENGTDTDDYGFCAYPTGERRDDGNWYQLNECTGFWFFKPGQSGIGSDQVYLHYNSGSVTIRGVNVQNFYPIRLVKDVT